MQELNLPKTLSHDPGGFHAIKELLHIQQTQKNQQLWVKFQELQEGTENM